jgi:hypothetical protein
LAFGVYYLFEENAFLRARQADPTLARVPGSRHEYLQIWSTISPFLFFAGVNALLVVSARARGLSFKQTLRAEWLKRPVQPLDERTRTFAIGAGLILVGCGVVVLAKTIQAHVWEGESIWGQTFLIYWSLYSGFALLGIVIRDYRLVNYGIPIPASRQLTAQQIEPIHRAMEDWHLIAAINLYREAVPDADLTEARLYVLRLAEAQRAKHPGKFLPPPPMSLTRLNWKAMLICAVIEAVILGLLWAIMLPPHPAWFAVEFVCGFLFALGLTAGLRVKGFWKLMLLMVPTTVVMVLGIAIVTYAAAVLTRSAAACVLVFFFGLFLMVSGFTPRRQKV